MFKYTALLLLCGLMSLPSLASASPTSDACELLAGDVDGTGTVDIYDIHSILAYLHYGSKTMSSDVLDVNGDDTIDMSDATYLRNYLWMNGPDPVPLVEPGDVNNDGRVDVSDLTALGAWYWAGKGEVCANGADVNEDGAIDLSDFISLTQMF